MAVAAAAGGCAAEWRVYRTWEAGADARRPATVCIPGGTLDSADSSSRRKPPILLFVGNALTPVLPSRCDSLARQEVTEVVVKRERKEELSFEREKHSTCISVLGGSSREKRLQTMTMIITKTRSRAQEPTSSFAPFNTQIPRVRPRTYPQMMRSGNFSTRNARERDWLSSGHISGILKILYSIANHISAITY